MQPPSSVTLDDEEIDNLNQYFTQIAVARPLLFYDKAADEAEVSAKLWDESRRFLVGLDEYSVSSHISKAVLDVGFHMIFSHSAIEYLLGLAVVNESSITVDALVPNNEKSQSKMDSISADDKARILEMAGYDIEDEVNDYKTLRNKLAHNFRVGNRFLDKSGEGVLNDVQSAREAVDNMCELAYEMSLQDVAREVQHSINFHEVGRLGTEPTGSIVLELTRRHSGMGPFYDSESVEGNTVDELRRELESRGYEPDYDSIDDYLYRPHVDTERPVKFAPGVQLGHVETIPAIATRHPNHLRASFVAYEFRELGYVPYKWKLVISISDGTVETIEGTDFDESGAGHRFHQVEATFSVDSLPQKPNVDAEVFVMVETENGNFVDVWQKSLLNYEWVKRKLGSVEDSLRRSAAFANALFKEGNEDISINHVESYLSKTAITLIRINQSSDIFSDEYTPDIPILVGKEYEEARETTFQSIEMLFRSKRARQQELNEEMYDETKPEEIAPPTDVDLEEYK